VGTLKYSVDFHDIQVLQHTGNWDTAGRLLAEAAQALERAGAQCLVLCTNTMHKVADRIEAALNIPLLHIADATGEAVRQAGLTTVGLLGTRFTMEERFYIERLEQRHGLTVLVPDPEERGEVHRIIYDELCAGWVLPASREVYRKVIGGLVARGAQGVILGAPRVAPTHRPVVRWGVNRAACTLRPCPWPLAASDSVLQYSHSSCLTGN
jgi:aspartate racemase